MNVIFRWVIGLSVSLIIGGFVTRKFLNKIRKMIVYEKPKYKVVPAWILGVVEGMFFTFAVAFNLSGVIIGMVVWMTAKMAAHWNAERQKEIENIEAIRFSSLLGSMVSLFFAMLGGLICAGKIFF